MRIIVNTGSKIDCDAFNNCNYYYVVGDSSDVDEFKVR